ncbi:MAG TPA: restriction endonuclease subunit S [Rhodanobacter sp.]|nr:restriction endonuclease subunit S [Rhodanobacter sp.]
MFRDCLLGDVLTLKRGYDLPSQSRIEGAIPVVSSSGISGTHSEAKVKGPGVVTGRYGTIGEVHYVPGDFWPLNTTLYVQDFKGNDPRFISYFLQTLDLASRNAASAVPGVNRNDLHRLPVRCPDIGRQRRVASILSAYDNLIENNTRRIAILEEMARRIYEEWFVRFRFPGHEGVRMAESELGLVPEGWSIQGLYDVAELTYGFPFKSKLFDNVKEGVGVIRIRDIKGDQTNTFTTETADPKYRVSNGDILVGMDGEFHMGCWAGGDAWLNQRVVRFRPLEGIPRSWLFLSTFGPIKVLESTIVGTTVAHLSARDLKEMRLVAPTQDVLRHAGEALEPLFDLALTLKLKNANLRTTRNLLLPKLVSGELDASELPAPEAIAA